MSSRVRYDHQTSRLHVFEEYSISGFWVTSVVPFLGDRAGQCICDALKDICDLFEPANAEISSKLPDMAPTNRDTL